VVFKGETLRVDGFRLTKVPTQPVPIHIAALREGMLKVAGEVGDGVILNWLSPDDVPRSVSVVREAAQRAGRDPEAIEVTARLFVNLDPPGPDADLVVRRHIAGYLNVPVYRAFQEWLGRTEALGPMWAAWGAGDRKAAVAAIPTRVMDDLIPRGSLAELKARIQLYLDRGIDTAFLSLMSSEPDPRKKRDRMLNALRAMAPAVEG
jgi:alkanesulfonate monooxygenase SsuD/methylene tetrahydromethanopterin reductase-like flavin-dependent oxidoreductase (luciferase family)